MQLDLFTPPPPLYPYQMQPNKKQQAIINEVFDGAEQISYVLGDVIELYHFKAWSRPTMSDQELLCIGASGSTNGSFYYYEPTTGSIYLLGAHSMFPLLNKRHHNN